MSEPHQLLTTSGPLLTFQVGPLTTQPAHKYGTQILTNNTPIEFLSSFSNLFVGELGDYSVNIQLCSSIAVNGKKCSSSLLWVMLALKYV